MKTENDGVDFQNIEISQEQKKARRFVTIWTCIYIILFPFVFWMSLWSILVFDNPSMTVPIGISIICAFLGVPFSMLVCVWKMWSKYFHAQYDKICWFCALPLLAFVFAICVNTVLQLFLSG